jgi:membrane protein YdbS with pleckstrin-like domain
MAQVTLLRLQPGERRVAVIRRHWWFLVRPLLWLAPLFVSFPVYATVEYAVPNADLARYADAFLAADLALCGFVCVKWLSHDFTGWIAESYLLTTRRIIGRQGIVTVEQREIPLHAVQEGSNVTKSAGARIFDCGDVQVQTAGRGAAVVIRRVAHPHRVESLIANQARIARDQLQRMHGPGEDAIQGALSRVFDGAVDPYFVPTVEIPRVTRLNVRVQRRINLLPGETVLVASRRHPVMLFKALLLPILLAAVGLGAASGLGVALPPVVMAAAFALVATWFLWRLVDWLDDLFVVTSERIIELRRMPLRLTLRNAVQLRAVHDVVLRVSLLGGRLLNVGTLAIELGGADSLMLVSVPQPDRIQRLILDGLDSAVERDRLQEQERLAGTLTDWFEEYHKLRTGQAGNERAAIQTTLPLESPSNPATP